MPTLTDSQMDYLEGLLNANDVLGFYNALTMYGDPYGRLGAAVTANNTWQGQIANLFLEGASGGSTYVFGTPLWQGLNTDLANSYLELYQQNSGLVPSWDQVQRIHNLEYEDRGLPANAWFPNMPLNNSDNPAALWDDYLVNEGAVDIWLDLIEIVTEAFTGDDTYALDFFRNLKYSIQNMDSISFNELLDSVGLGVDYLIRAIKNGEWSNVLNATIKTFADWFGAFNPLSPPPADPLVIDLNGDGFNIIGTADSNVNIDMDGNSYAERIGWVGAQDGLLVLDRNSDGNIDLPTDLFGNATTDGYVALKAFDTNNDNKITSADTRFGDMKVWQDLDGDGVVDAGELKTLTELGITQLSLASTSSGQMINGTTINATSTITLADGSTRQMGSAYFATEPLISQWVMPPVSDNALQETRAA